MTDTIRQLTKSASARFGLLVCLLVIGGIFSPVPVSAKSGLVPCGYDSGATADNCTFDNFLELINTVDTFIIFTLATPAAVLGMFYAGFLYLTSGGSKDLDKAKGIFTAAFWGFVIVLSAYLVVTVVVNGLLSSSGGPAEAVRSHLTN